MIAFDNGPADGDYVRYIDDLMARAAANASAGTLAPGREVGGYSPAALINRLGAPGNVIGRALEAVKPGSNPAPQRTDATVFDNPPERAASPTPARMSGRVDAGPAISQRMKNTLVAIMIGFALLLVGIFSAPISPFLILLGVLLTAWAGRRLILGAALARQRRPEI